MAEDNTLEETPSPETYHPKHGLIVKKPRVAIYWTVGLSLIVLCLNIAFLIYAEVESELEVGASVLYTGDCTKVKRLKLWLHLLINILSTTLEASSTFCIHLLNAPRRDEVDKAHAEGKSFRIGIHDVGNLMRVQWWKRWTIYVLAFSSWTLTLIYNATLFDSFATTSYSVLGVRPSFLNDASYDLAALGIADTFRDTEARYLQRQSTTFQKLNNRQCLDTYREPLVPDHGDLLLVLEMNQVSVASNSSVLSWHDSCFGCAGSVDWLCNGIAPASIACTPTLVEVNLDKADDWSVSGGLLGGEKVKVSYCLSQKTPERCALKCSRTMTIIVVVWNIVKTACFIVAALDSRLSLLKVGDAIYSFLRSSDDTTAGTGQMPPMRAFQRRWRQLGPRSVLRDDWVERYSGGRVRRWWTAVSSGRWLVFSLLCVLAISLGAGLLGHSIHKLGGKYPQDFGHLWTLGFGAVSGYTLLTGGVQTGIVGNSVIANLPQLMISSLHFSVLSIVSSQLAEREWNRFGYESRMLRTTFPSPGESSLWYLSVPYTYSGPILLLFIWLHLGVSQSMFASEVSFYTYDGRIGPVVFSYDQDKALTEGLTLSTLSASPIALIVSFWLLSIMIVLIGLNSLRRYHVEMPYPGTDTAVIAACSRSDEEAETLLQSRIRWTREVIDNPSSLAGGSFLLNYKDADDKDAYTAKGKTSAKPSQSPSGLED